MTDITTLRGLIARLNAGTGPDADLDADIRIVTPERYESDLRRGKKRGTVTAKYACHDGRSSHGTFNAPDYTRKLDDAVRLYPALPDRIPNTPRAVCVEALGVRLGILIAKMGGRNNG